MNDIRKVVTFALAGAAGCLLAAFLGEIWLLSTYQPPAEASQRIAMVLDCSTSMAGQPLEEMKAAAIEFVSGRNFSTDQAAVIVFGSQAEMICPLTPDKERLINSIKAADLMGSTNMGDGLRVAKQTLGNLGNRTILFFTDGMPDSSFDALQHAAECKRSNIQIVAVATGGANTALLSQVTGDASLVFPADAGKLKDAFRKASEAIGRRQLLESRSGGGGFIFEVVRSSIWTALLAAGLTCALIAGQNYYFRRKIWSQKQLAPAVAGGFGSGLLAGVIVQTVFGALSDAPDILIVVGRMLGWVALGALIGLAVSYFIPNLSKRRGITGGAQGGAIGGVLFLVSAFVVGDFLGRFQGAIALGLMIGAMIAFAEVSARKYWLDVSYGPKEKRSVTLGSNPIAVGSSPELCQVVVRNTTDVTYRYTLTSGRIWLEDLSANRTIEVFPDDVRTVGAIKLIVRQQSTTSPTSSPQLSPAREHASKEPAASQKPTPNTAQNPAPTPNASGNATGFFLHANGRHFPLIENANLTSQQLGLRDGDSPQRAVATIVRNPSNHEVFGLKNLMSITWQATMANQELRSVEPGKSVKLAKGTRIQIGQISISIE